MQNASTTFDVTQNKDDSNDVKKLIMTLQLKD